jgi:hypothetical protein
MWAEIRINARERKRQRGFYAGQSLENLFMSFIESRAQFNPDENIRLQRLKLNIGLQPAPPLGQVFLRPASAASLRLADWLGTVIFYPPPLCGTARVFLFLSAVCIPNL